MTSQPLSGDAPGAPRTITPFQRLSLLRKLRTVGGISIVAGVVLLSHPLGILLLVAGAALWGIDRAARLRDRRTRSADRAAAAVLAEQLVQGEWPPAVLPTGISRPEKALAPDERCFLAQVDVEALEWYGDPVQITNRFFLAWGSPLAWMFSIVGTLLFWKHNRNKRRKAQPRWRDPDPAHLWLTDRAFILHGKSGYQSWVRWEYESSIQDARLESDGIVLLLAEQPPVRVKLRLAPAAWSFVLFRFAATGQVVQLQPSFAERLKAVGALAGR